MKTKEAAKYLDISKERLFRLMIKEKVKVTKTSNVYD